MADITSNLIAHWKMDGNADDSSVLGADHSGTVSGATAISDNGGNAGGALSFDGANDKMTITQHSELQFLNSRDMSVSFWVNRPSIGTASHLLYFEADLSPYYGWLIQFTAAGQILTEVRGPTVAYGTSTGTAMSANTWYHIVVTYDRSGNGTFYRDGVEQNSFSMSALETANLTGPGDYNISSAVEGSLFYLSKLDEIRIYHRVLAQADITELANEFSSPSLGFSKINGISTASLSKINGIDLANISKINGV